MDQPTILVVEDNPDHVAMIEAVFARGLEDARIHVAFRGQGAKRYLRGQWVAYEDDIDYYPLPTLVVLDLWLPDTTGLDILEWMAEREWLSEIPVIVFTASTNPDHFQRAYELGARRCLSKPTEFGELVEVVRGEIERQAEPMIRSAARWATTSSSHLGGHGPSKRQRTPSNPLLVSALPSWMGCRSPGFRTESLY